MNGQTSVAIIAPTLRSALRRGFEVLRRAGVESPWLDAEVLLCHALALNRTALYVRAEDILSADEEERFHNLLVRRSRREPVAYVTGNKEFWSLDFAVDKNALIPRPETELLVELALDYAARTEAHQQPLAILDIGTGSGAIAVALASELRSAEISAVDLSGGALALARANARRHGVQDKIKFYRGDLFEPFERERRQFDLIVTNPPYIGRAALDQLPPEIRLYEPVAALDGGPDGLDYYRRIVANASQYLTNNGAMLLEIGAEQALAVQELLAQTDAFLPAVTYRDLAGQERVIAAQRSVGRG